MTSPSEPRTPRLYHAPLPPAGAVVWAAASIATMFVVQILVFATGLINLLVGVAGDLAVIALLVFRFRRDDLLAILGVRRVAPRFAVAGVLVGLTAWYPAMRLVLWVQDRVELPGTTKVLEQLVADGPLVPTLLAIALAPAIAEEIMFRGVLARGLATRWPRFAVVGSAVAFSAFHLLPAQMIGVLPLGLALGFLAIRADSMLPTMVAHFINNVIGLVLSRNAMPAALTSPIDSHPNAALAIALVISGTGLALGSRGLA